MCMSPDRACWSISAATAAASRVRARWDNNWRGGWSAARRRRSTCPSRRQNQFAFMHSGPSASGASCSTAGSAIVSECSVAVSFPRKRDRETLPCHLISGQPKSQPLRFIGKDAHMDTMASQFLDDVDRLGMPGEAEQRRSAEHGKARGFQHGIEPLPTGLKARGRRGKPWCVAERRLADRECGARNCPRSELGADEFSQRGFRNRKAEPQSGQSVRFAEGPQNDRARRQFRGDALCFRQYIDKSFVDDEQPVLVRKRRGDGAKRVRRNDTSGRVVGVDDDDNIGAVALLEIIHQRNAMSLSCPACPVLLVGRPKNRNVRLCREARKKLDQGLRARSRK